MKGPHSMVPVICDFIPYIHHGFWDVWIIFCFGKEPIDLLASNDFPFPFKSLSCARQIQQLATAILRGLGKGLSWPDQILMSTLRFPRLNHGFCLSYIWYQGEVMINNRPQWFGCFSKIGYPLSAFISLGFWIKKRQVWWFRVLHFRATHLT